MTTEESRRLTRERHEGREFGDTDPLLEAEIREMRARNERKARESGS